MLYRLEALLAKTKIGDQQAAEEILMHFMPLIRKYAYLDNIIDEDLLGELSLAALKCIMRFKLNENDYNSFIAAIGSGESSNAAIKKDD